MKIDKIRFEIKKILKKLKILKNNSPNWKSILSDNYNLYKEIKLKAKNGQKILICTSSGGHLLSSHFESLLALSLTRYGANVEIMLCDKALKACQMTTSQFVEEKKFLNQGQLSLCNSCLDNGRAAFEELGLKINYYSKFISKKDEIDILEKVKNLSMNEMLNYTEDNMNLGEHANAGALRYYAVGELLDIPNNLEVLRKYLISALTTKKIFDNFFIKKKFDKIILNHGIYVPQGVICDISKKSNIKIITYTNAYRKNSFIFNYDDTYHRTMIDEETKDWEDMILDSKKEKTIMNYLKSRKTGKNDMFYYFKNPSFKIENLLLQHQVDLSKPILGLLTNIIWDAQIIYKNNIYKNMIEWLIDTIKYLSKRNDIQVVVRCHPGEVHSDRVSNQKVKATILERITNIPENLKIIDSSSDISTYSFASYCNTMIIYATKLGMEFSPFGNKIICAGESYIKNKKITLDPKDRSEYYKLLDKFPNIKDPSVENILRAKKYAYHYFFRRTVQINTLESKIKSWPPFHIPEDSFKKIYDNKDIGLKLLCEKIISNEKFIFDY